ncbi:type III-B CRISPR module-associated protein Cmr5 [Desulfococcus sp.]|uniref:type III-B CRISPR module-associated protein Cmr5 n=1 Tax=Desulfococcus sp. TaxID=2025834 RepID=UPI00359475FB
MRTLGQKRAAFALEEVLNNHCKSQKDFKTFCSGAPSVILQNGFGQALAFWFAKGKGDGEDKHQVILDIIQKWLCLKEGDIQNEFIDACKPTKAMVIALATMNQEAYLAAQKETLALLEWVKRYANALLKGD